MSSRWGSSESRWSSERERAERERAERERAQQGGAGGSGARRRSWREGTSGTHGDTGSKEPESTRRPGTAGGSTRSDAPPSSPSGEKPPLVGRKWRSSAPPPPDEGPSLPNLPGDDQNGGRGGVSNRILIFGAILFVLMAIAAFLPFGPLGGGDDDEPTPTQPVAVVPTAEAQDPDNPDAGTPESTIRPADSEMVVCIDAGHGGWDFGRQRQQDGDFDPPLFNESEINLAMAIMLREELEERGVTVVMTRESGAAVNVFNDDINGDGRTLADGEQDGNRDELQARINICNDANADVLISLHLNGFDNPDARGYEVLYTPYPTREFGELNLDLANALYREIGAAYNDVGFETEPRGPKSDEADLEAELHEFGSEENLVLTGPAVSNNDYTIVPSNMPGAFVEPVFITNQEDANFIVQVDNQRLLARAYADGIMNYFEQHPG